MDIKGFIGVSLVDWNGKVSSVIFLPGCNFRCPFCYNTKLVLQPAEMSTIPLGRILDYLEKNRRWIDGVVVTGGEPTINEDLSVLCQEIKKLDFLVKLDTNGTNPEMTQRLIEQRLIDYMAVDLKAPFIEEKYSKASGIKSNAVLPYVEKTTQTLLEGGIDYEFRTTLVPTIHQISDIREICEKIKGCRKYVLQNFRADVETVNPDFEKLKPFSNAEVESFFQAARSIISSTLLRK